MISHKDHFHGSDLEKIEEIYHIPKEQIISFSANVNPLGLSPLLKRTLAEHIDVLQSYPDRKYHTLKESIASYVGTSAQNIVVGNGTTELISLFIELVAPKKALIVGPTYSEYERSVSLAGGQSFYYALKEEHDFKLNVSHFLEKLNDSIDLLILCNPNNPTSSAIPKADMRKILDCCMEHGIFVMVDETYVEFVEDLADISSVSLANDYTNLVILRGVSKFFAAPGLRLGYAITGNRALHSRYDDKSNPWTINSLAALAGEMMYRDTDYIRQTRDLISSERDRIYARFLASDSYQAYKPHANFMLVKIKDPSLTSGDLFDRCIREGLMIRDCSTFPFLSNRFIRFCFMKPEDNDKLLSCLCKQ